MGKIHVPMTEVKRSFRHVFSIPYCEAQHLLHNSTPHFYNAGIYGWNCDVYVFPQYDLAICTGYRNLVGTHVPYYLIDKFDREAEDILNSGWTTSWDEVRECISDLLDEFLQELLSLEQ